MTTFHAVFDLSVQTRIKMFIGRVPGRSCESPLQTMHRLQALHGCRAVAYTSSEGDQSELLGVHIICATFFLRDIPSARHLNCATSHLRDFSDARHFNCAISHLRDFPVARHPNCATFQLRDIPSARHPICATFFFTFWKPRWTSFIWPNLTKPNLT